MQKPEELAELLRILDHESVRRVLEIGSGYGGTLWTWWRLCGPYVSAPSTQSILSVDLNHAQMTDAYADRITLITANSHQSETVERVRAAIDELDFLFIDGDHSYEGVKADFEMYRHLVRPGGLIGFHDIVNEGADVPAYWTEIRKDELTIEIIGPEDPAAIPKWCGIGLMRVR